MKLNTQLRLAANLKQLRTGCCLTQAELASHLQISRSVLALYESGQRCPDPETLYDIACFFGVPMEKLLHASPEIILSEAIYLNCGNTKEQTLLKHFHSLSPFSRGRLLEKAEDLRAWDSALDGLRTRRK